MIPAPPEALELREHRDAGENEEEYHEEERIVRRLALLNDKPVEQGMQDGRDRDAGRNRMAPMGAEGVAGNGVADDRGGKAVEEVRAKEPRGGEADAAGEILLEHGHEEEDILDRREPQSRRDHVDHRVHRLIERGPVERNDLDGEVLEVFLHE